ncbi:MAG: pyrroline-5-carboxylate reductase [Desulfobacteraceae bacterium]|nr:MAG: pyrroline-5-carboxylate reductase [Desulfobacteraceae bacterium]
MGEAIIGALLRSEISLPEEILISDPSRERLAHLQNKYAVGIAQNNLDLFLQSEIVILAVKPQAMEPVVREITEAPEYQSVSDNKLMISIAAGVTIQKLEALFYLPSGNCAPEKKPIIRVMPNTPAMVLSGMSGMSGNQYASPADRKTARVILEAMGSVVEVKEEDMDAVTAVSGSGPAYVFFLAESMIEAGIALGFDPDTAVTLTMKTIEGALKLMQESTDTPETLRKKVTSPGGTTEAAFQVLSANRVKAVMVEAISRAAERSRELSGN